MAPALKATCCLSRFSISPQTTMLEPELSTVLARVVGEKWQLCSKIKKMRTEIRTKQTQNRFQIVDFLVK